MLLLGIVAVLFERRTTVKYRIPVRTNLGNVVDTGNFVSSALCCCDKFTVI
jgi:hypothetical protein